MSNEAPYNILNNINKVHRLINENTRLKRSAIKLKEREEKMVDNLNKIEEENQRLKLALIEIEIENKSLNNQLNRFNQPLRPSKQLKAKIAGDKALHLGVTAYILITVITILLVLLFQ